MVEIYEPDNLQKLISQFLSRGIRILCVRRRLTIEVRRCLSSKMHFGFFDRLTEGITPGNL
jgi:hypothetical protein